MRRSRDTATHLRAFDRPLLGLLGIVLCALVFATAASPSEAAVRGRVRELGRTVDRVSVTQGEWSLVHFQAVGTATGLPRGVLVRPNTWLARERCEVGAAFRLEEDALELDLDVAVTGIEEVASLDVIPVVHTRRGPREVIGWIERQASEIARHRCSSGPAKDCAGKFPISHDFPVAGKMRSARCARMKTAAPSGRPRSEKELLDRALRELIRRLPPGWERGAGARPDADGEGADLVAEVSGPGGRRALLVFEAKNVAYPRDLRGPIERLRRLPPRAVPVFVAPFVGPQARSMLTEAGVGYVDLTGNVRIVVSSPALFLSDRGADANPWPERGQVRTFGGPRAGRLVRALCDFSPPYGVGELASLTGVTAGYVSKVLAALRREDLIERTPRGPVTFVAWRRVLETWARDYSLLESNVARLYLAARGIGDVLARLRTLPPTPAAGAAVTGSAAAARVAPVAPPTRLFIYAPDAVELATRLGLVPADTAGNVFLLEPSDPVVFERTTVDDAVTYVAPSQAAIDCLTGPDRMPEEARALLAWMEAHERRWRASVPRRAVPGTSHHPLPATRSVRW